ncbi:hypothetical protein PEC18_36705 [Paucibacter sp. O1-1]|nr:hypothetical protein [Paucibacter sp. O1-1]MDA3831195.1 hypothetical protein [Paucibacter sp. O1-1]
MAEMHAQLSATTRRRPAAETRDRAARGPASQALEHGSAEHVGAPLSNDTWARAVQLGTIRQLQASPRSTLQRERISGLHIGAAQSTGRDESAATRGQDRWQAGSIWQGAQAEHSPRQLRKTSSAPGATIQRMLDTTNPVPSNTPIIPVPGQGKVEQWNPERQEQAPITKAVIKKQPALYGGDDNKKRERHLRHWWVVFQTASNSWMEVDLNLNQGYRVQWGKQEPSKDAFRVKEVSVPTGLTTEDVLKAVGQFAVTKQEYYNSANPIGRERYSCQDFVKQLLMALKNQSLEKD